MAERKTPSNNEELRLTLFQSVSLLSSPPDLAAEFHKALDQEEVRQKARDGCQALKEHYEAVWTISPEQLQEYNLKEQFILPLNVLLGLLSLYHGNWEKQFTPSSRALIKTTLQTLHKIRVRLHIQYNEHKDIATPSRLERGEIDTLHKAYWLLISPLYAHFEQLFETLVLDPPVAAFNNMLQEAPENTPSLNLTRYFASHLCETKASNDELKQHYRKTLNKPSLAQALLEVLEKQVAVTPLASLKAHDGWSYAKVQDARYVTQALFHFTTDIPSEFVVQAHSLGKRYLRPEIARNLLDTHGNIKKTLKDCFHNVSRVAEGPYDLHFKQKPNNPLMEFGVHSLSYRVAGKSTPAIELVRFEVGGRVYPVLVSQTIQGNTLDPNLSDSIERASLTRMLLLSTLTRPGDGRASNYIVNAKEVYCIDNDVSFVEPVVKSKTSRQVKLSSILFCFDRDWLHKEALQDFVRLNPDVILRAWMEELIQKEREYQSLFSEAERTRLYEEDPENRFTPTLLFKEGTIGTLYLQFHHLQNAIKEKGYELSGLDLLEALTTLGNRGETNLVGANVAKKYAQSFRYPTKKRLEKALAKSQEKSMTSSESMRAIFGKVPTVEEIERKQTFGLTKAREELYALALDQFLEGSSIVQRTGETVLRAPFEKIEPSRQELILEALQALVQMEKFRNPVELSLTHCEALNSKTKLDPFLSERLRVLDVSYCPNLKTDMIELIAKRCPSLEELYLNDSGIEALAEIPFLGQAKSLKMPNLKTLHISRCKNLRMIKLETSPLADFKAKDNPWLLEADLEAVMPIINGSPCKPRTVWRDIKTDLLEKILPLFPSAVILENQYIYGILSDRLSKSEIQKIFEPQNDCLTQLDLD